MGIREVNKAPGLFAARAYDDETKAADEGDDADYGRDVDVFGLLMLDLNRTHIDVFLFMLVGESAHGEADDAKHDQEDSNDSCCLHLARPFLSFESSAVGWSVLGMKELLCRGDLERLRISDD